MSPTFSLIIRKREVAPPGWSPVTTCYTATISGCGVNGGNVDDIGLTFGGIYTGSGNPQGTIVFFTGGTGQTVQDANMNIAQYTADYQNTFEVVYIAWEDPWEKPNQSSDPSAPGGSILLAACRPATFLSYINGSTSGFHNAGAMCAQGSSAGSAEIAYSMSWYDAASYLTNVQLLSGPVLSEIDAGCNYSNVGSDITVCGSGAKYCSPKTTTWSSQESYTLNDAGDIDSWSAQSGCTLKSQSSGAITDWADMSIVDGSLSTGGPHSTSPNSRCMDGFAQAPTAEPNSIARTIQLRKEAFFTARLPMTPPLTSTWR